MAINSLLSTTESKKQTANRQKRNRIIDMETIETVASGELSWGNAGKGEGIKKYKLVGTE